MLENNKRLRKRTINQGFEATVNLSFSHINGYMIYRKQKLEEITTFVPGVCQTDVSVITAKWWKELTEQQKKLYNDEAADLRRWNLIPTEWNRINKQRQRYYTAEQFRTSDGAKKKLLLALYQNGPSKAGKHRSMITIREAASETKDNPMFINNSKSYFSENDVNASISTALAPIFNCMAPQLRHLPFPKFGSKTSTDNDNFSTHGCSISDNIRLQPLIITTKSPIYYHYTNGAISYSIPLELPPTGRYYPSI
ncbi:hypothetical protein BDF20DRAFT_911745 [Mycotypha africana]|uniref:uncharacterized protein n=1 Tax=Mycotypha africana TaxID=64632 RepID=UPI002300307E|nr:uncharacterized protein BDF20DRAFT_911745 [Mycotypha africana]KAI8984670.1 hypothetical protein BDF20DRAFT_911745 [Mycotypha africana]